ncbi:MAG: hypothetical protein A2X81_14090 [Desulfobacterales bacterium GWB2_56_26]|nr:MAG: hypothetical protein A2X81_14090 [Desulfobacterales bacterium GWB2_56_26]
MRFESKSPLVVSSVTRFTVGVFLGPLSEMKENRGKLWYVRLTHFLELPNTPRCYDGQDEKFSRACRLDPTDTSMKKDGIGHRCFPLLLCCLLVLFCGAPAMAGDKPLKIGVLATRGVDHCRRSWTPTADYLTGKIAGRTFVIVPLPHERVAASVRANEVDFILTNSSLYVELEEGYGINRIATLKERRLDRAYSRYGSVIFARKDRTDIRTFHDLKGKSFMGVAEESLGGWLMARRELEEAGLTPARDFARLSFGETHDEVIFAVRDGLVDAGSVRTGTMESLTAEGKIDLTDFYALPRLHDPKTTTPYLCSTREYPDWPMAKVKETPDELAEKVAVALLQMPGDSPAALAAENAGWTIPANYQPVMELMMALRVGPYKDLGKVTVRDILRNYGPWFVVVFLMFCTHAAFTLLVMKLNRRIKAAHLSLLTEIDLHRKTDKELEQAKQQAEAATLAKSQFLANMSHEIRTPMNGIIAATDLAMAEAVSPEVERYLHIVQNSSYALLGIINDILDFSKIEAGQLGLKERVFRLDEMFDRVMEVFVNQAAEKSIELLVDIEWQTPRILFGDSLRLQQILTNLISNSMKFTPPGGIVLIGVRDISAETDGLVDEQVMLTFAVRDSGSGIDPAYMPYLFEPFTQGDTSSTRKHEGTGLGLSICKKFVTMMQGTIRAESVLGQGSTFAFTIRLVKAGSNLPSRYVFPADIRSLNVLVVDDCADSREIMTKMLGAFGFRVQTVSSGAEAVARLSGKEQEQDPIELVLMDGKMPGMDGLDASRIIRQELRLSLPIIMMTAFSREVHKSEAEKVGTNGFLTKPIFQSTLFDAIMDAFGKEGVHRGATKRDFTTKASIYKKHLQGCRILVAEDNLTNQQVAQAVLGGAGIGVTIVANGEEAVEAVGRERFDAVLMDIQMPKMNGYEATKAIRKLPGCDILPIIAMTAHAMKGDEEKCLEAGMDGYVSKPINQDRLFYTLWRRLRNRSRAAGEGGELPPLPEEDREQEVIDGRPVDFNLPGIDVGRVLQSTGLDWRTFQDILAGFYQDNRDTIARLTRAMAENDRETLIHLSHSLKGSAGNIGAGELREAADELEISCSEQQPAAAIEVRCRELQQELTRLLTLFAQMTEPQGKKEALHPPHPLHPITGQSDLTMLLADLTEAIDRADPEEIKAKMAEAIGRLRDLPLIEASLLTDLETETSRYDYDQAKKTIHSLRNSLGGLQ